MELLMVNPTADMFKEIILSVLVWFNELLGGVDLLELIIEAIQNAIVTMGNLI